MLLGCPCLLSDAKPYHLILRPCDTSGMSKALNEIHRRNTRYINFRNKWTGHLWQSRYSSFVLSDRHLYNAMHYVEGNPVRASLCSIPEDW